MRHPVRPAALVLALALAGCGAERSVERTVGAGVDAAAQAIEAMEPDTGPAAAAPAIPRFGEARMDGYGSLAFGMDAAQARRAWNGNPLQPAEGPPDPEACHLLAPAGQSAPRQLAFLFEGGRFRRYDVASSELAAPGGGRVGMDQAALQGLYGGRLQRTPHKYIEGGAVLASPEDDGEVPSRLVFELGADGRVIAWRVGLAPQVDYVEHCG